jgi:hypothetical protein
MKYAKHPAVVFAAGVLVGVVFYSKLKSVPGVNKLPSV